MLKGTVWSGEGFICTGLMMNSWEMAVPEKASVRVPIKVKTTVASRFIFVFPLFEMGDGFLGSGGGPLLRRR